MQTAPVGGVAGNVGDEPWGATLASIARNKLSGQLQLRGDDAKLYRIAFVDGHIVAATSPSPADAIARIALTTHMITSTQVALVSKRLVASPNRDEIDVVADTVRLSVDNVVKLRRRAMLQRSARTFALERGEYRLDPEITLPRMAGIDIDVRGVIALGARMNLGDYRLTTDLRKLGSRFRLRTTCELAPYEFGPELAPVLESLRDGATAAELDVRHRDIEPRIVQSILYALVTGDACEVLEGAPVALPRTITPPAARTRSSSPSIVDLASRTRTIPWQGRRLTTEAPVEPRAVTKPTIALADEAFHRGVLALRRDDIEEAVVELHNATQLAPQDVDYAAMLAWARFCAAPDKQVVAVDTRRVLERAVHKSPKPMMARFYLGRVERMLGRTREALYHFRQVIDLEPGHADAAAEIRMLEPRAAERR